MKQPIYTEKTKCRDCYKCVRYCPVKAIKVENNSAQIIHDLCVFCGRCVHICPAGAKKVRRDVSRVKEEIASGRKVILSIAPSWSTGFLGSREQMIGKFKALGFDSISETALGAHIISGKISGYLDKTTEMCISSACPSIVELLRKYHPEYIDCLTPFLSPLGAHSSLLKNMCGSDSVVVFAGPCIAKKLEADNPLIPVDYALTFDEILEWLEEEKPEASEGDHEFFPCSASDSTLYALEGGMIETLKGNKRTNTMIPLSGMGHIIDALQEIGQDSGTFLELLSCPGGCVNGSGFSSSKKQFSYRKKSLDHYDKATGTGHNAPSLVIPAEESLKMKYEAGSLYKLSKYTDQQIDCALEELGKGNNDDQLDCGGCGYNSCRDFAVAFLREMGEKQMCVTNMRKRAQRKVDMLLKTLPMGVVIVNRQMQIVECNSEFASMFSDEHCICDEHYVRSHFNLPLSNFVELSSYLRIVLSGEKNLFQERIKYNGKFLRGSFFSIEQGALAGIILQDITTTSVKREDVIKKAEEVINKNLQNVQQIASLLGENAAETEIILRSLTDQFQFATTEVDL